MCPLECEGLIFNLCIFYMCVKVLFWICVKVRASIDNTVSVIDAYDTDMNIAIANEVIPLFWCWYQWVFLTGQDNMDNIAITNELIPLF